MKTTPLAYQKQAIERIGYLLETVRFAMLEAGMGTGKTLMSLALYEKLAPKKLVIVAPKTLLGSWNREIQKHTDMTEPFAWKSSAGDRYKKELAALTSGAFLVNVEAFQRDNPQLLAFLSRFVDSSTLGVLDESSKVKDQGAHRTKAISKAFVKAGYKLAMTGTMNANSPLDVYGQFLFLNPNFWKSQGLRNWHIFQSNFGVLQEFYGPNGTTFKKIVGYRRLAELKSLIDPFIVTVDKATVLDLPPKVWDVVHVTLGKEERKAYDDMKRDMITMLASGAIVAADQAMQLYNKFRMICGGWIETETLIVPHPAKLEALEDLVEDSGEQMLIFANYTHEVDQITASLHDKGIAVARYDGSVPVPNRQEIVDRFNAGELRAIVAQPLAGAYGLNLQARCNTIIYYSRPNSPEVFLQSQDRIHRMGQSKTCFYIDLVATDTIDSKIIEALEKKEDLSKIFRQTARHNV